MPAKALTRSVQPTYKGHASHIPTTIKNPERVAHRRTELIEVATKMFLERGLATHRSATSYANVRSTLPAFTCTFPRKRPYTWVAQDLMKNIAQRSVETVLDPDLPERSLKSVLPATARSSAASAAQFACSTVKSDFCHPSRARM
jgi:hypothetical protein